RHQQVAEVRVGVPVERVRPRDYDGLGGLCKGQFHEWRLDYGQTVEQELRVEARGDVLAGDRRLDRLRRHRLVAAAGVEGQHPVAERQLHRRVALRDQRDALDRVDQGG